VKKNSLNGFGLIESIVSLVIFTVLLLGLNYSLILSIEHNTSNFLRNTATKIAQGYADKLRTDNSTTSTGASSECDPNDGIDKDITYINLKNTNIKFETVYNFTPVPNTNNNVLNLHVTTCYNYKGVKKVEIDTKIYKGKAGL